MNLKLLVLVLAVGCTPVTKNQCLLMDRAGENLPFTCLEMIAFPIAPTLEVITSHNFEERMRAANLNFTAGCVLTAIDMCSTMNDALPARSRCYARMDLHCNHAARQFEKWLRNGRNDVQI